MTTAESQPDTATQPAAALIPEHRSLLDALLNSVIAGMLPWIAHSVIIGPGRFEEAAAASFGLSLLLFAAAHRRRDRRRIKPLEVFDLAYFAALSVLGLVAGDSVLAWLGLWGGEMTNLALVVFAVGSIIVRQPFTLAYAKESTPPEVWQSPVFLRITYRISAVWAASFTVSAVAGFIGDAVLKDSDNFWTGWILQIGANIFAIAFTEWYPPHARAKALQAVGKPTAPPTPLIELFVFLPAFVIAVGVSGLVTDSISTTLGVGLIAVGAVGWVGMMRLTGRKIGQSGQG